MLPLILAAVAVTLTLTTGVVFCLPRIVPLQVTLTMGKAKR